MAPWCRMRGLHAPKTTTASFWIGLSSRLKDFGVQRADAGERFLGVLRKADLRIRAEQRERFLSTKLVPQMLKPYRSGRMSVRPHQCHHLPEGADLSAVASGAAEQIGDDVGKQLFIG